MAAFLKYVTRTAFVLALVSAAQFDAHAAEAPPDLLRLWGSSGTAPGQFGVPVGVAFAPNGDVLVVEGPSGPTAQSGNRVQRFTALGTFVSLWTVTGIELPNSCGIVCDAAGNSYVTDSGNQTIRKYSPTGVLLGTLGSGASNNGGLRTPRGIAIGSTGNLYVADNQAAAVVCFSPSGVVLSRWVFTFTPDGVAVGPTGDVFVTDVLTNVVREYSSSGVEVRHWGGTGTANGAFRTPTRVSCDLAGNVYVADNGNSRIRKFSPTGAFLAKWGTAGSAPGQFLNQVGVDVAPTGEIYVADTNNSRVQVFGYPTTPAQYVSWGALKSAWH